MIPAHLTSEAIVGMTVIAASWVLVFVFHGVIAVELLASWGR